MVWRQAPPLLAAVSTTHAWHSAPSVRSPEKCMFPSDLQVGFLSTQLSPFWMSSAAHMSLHTSKRTCTPLPIPFLPAVLPCAGYAKLFAASLARMLTPRWIKWLIAFPLAQTASSLIRVSPEERDRIKAQTFAAHLSECTLAQHVQI